MFPSDFRTQRFHVNDVEICATLGGSGPPLILLHGFPQTRLIWHCIAPMLAESHTLLIPDLRGYGDSSTPPGDPEHRRYSKREMAKDIIAIADQLGFERFGIAGHDRGGRVAYRLVLDHPGRVTRLCAVDMVPTLDVWEEMDTAATVSAFHWSFLAASAPLPEQLIGQNPRLFYGALLERWAGDVSRLDARAVAAYLGQYDDPEKIHAQCEDYRAGAGVDRSYDLESRAAGAQLDCPVLLLWSTGYLSDKARSPAATWRKWATDVRELAIDCGHFIVEEKPDIAGPAMLEFFSDADPAT